jgi:hypothetical protein
MVCFRAFEASAISTLLPVAIHEFFSWNKKLLGAGQRLALRKMQALLLGYLAAELLTGDGEPSPILKYIAGKESEEAHYRRLVMTKQDWRIKDELDG